MNLQQQHQQRQRHQPKVEAQPANGRASALACDPKSIEHMFETFHQSSSTNSKPTFYNPFKVKQRRRTTKQQYKILEEVFQTNQKPNAAIRKELATKLGMTPRGVQIWYQNKRASEKKLKAQQQAKATAIPLITIDNAPNETTNGTQPKGQFLETDTPNLLPTSLSAPLMSAIPDDLTMEMPAFSLTAARLDHEMEQKSNPASLDPMAQHAAQRPNASSQEALSESWRLTGRKPNVQPSPLMTPQLPPSAQNQLNTVPTSSLSSSNPMVFFPSPYLSSGTPMPMAPNMYRASNTSMRGQSSFFSPADGSMFTSPTESTSSLQDAFSNDVLGTSLFQSMSSYNYGRDFRMTNPSPVPSDQTTCPNTPQIFGDQVFGHEGGGRVGDLMQPQIQVKLCQTGSAPTAQDSGLSGLSCQNSIAFPDGTKPRQQNNIIKDNMDGGAFMSNNQYGDHLSVADQTGFMARRNRANSCPDILNQNVSPTGAVPEPWADSPQDMSALVDTIVETVNQGSWNGLGCSLLPLTTATLKDHSDEGTMGGTRSRPRSMSASNILTGRSAERDILSEKIAALHAAVRGESSTITDHRKPMSTSSVLESSLNRSFSTASGGVGNRKASHVPSFSHEFGEQPIQPNRAFSGYMEEIPVNVGVEESWGDILKGFNDSSLASETLFMDILNHENQMHPTTQRRSMSMPKIDSQGLRRNSISQVLLQPMAELELQSDGRASWEGMNQNQAGEADGNYLADFINY